MERLFKRINPGAFRFALFLIFLAASCYFIVNMLLSLSANPVIKLILVFIGVGVDVYCQLIYAEARQLWKRKPEGWSRFNPFKLRAVGRFIIYGVYIVFFAIFSGIGFFVAELNTTERALTVNTIRIEQIDSRLSQISNNLASYQIGLNKELSTGYGPRAVSIQNTMTTLEDEQNRLQTEKNSLKKADSETVNISSDMFSTVERAFPFLPANTMKILVFAILMIIIYTGLITNGIELPAEENKPSETPKETSEKVSETPAPAPELSDEKKNMIKFIEAALRPTGVLDGDEKVSQKTGIPLEICRAYRNFLRSLRVASTGTPLIESQNQGATRANFPLEYIKQVIIGRP